MKGESMKHCIGKRHAVVVCIMGALLGGCTVVRSGCDSLNARCERTVEIEQPMAPGLLLTAVTEFGGIDVVGGEAETCRLTARIHVQAESDELAKQIADQIEVSLVSSPHAMDVVIQKPEQNPKYSSGVALTLHVPVHTLLDLRTSFGAVNVTGIRGDVKLHTSFGEVSLTDVRGDIKAETSFGGMHAQRVAGPLKLNTSYGAIHCSAVQSERIELDTSFGSVTVSDVKSESPLTAQVNTSNAGIDFACPEGFAGRVDASTSFGKICSDQPVTVQGDFGKDQLRGTIGQGKGAIRLQTSFGNIHLK
jgi:hypothetical protein